MKRSSRAWMLFLATRIAGLCIDAAVLALAYWSAIALRFDFQMPRWGWKAVALSFVTVCLVYLAGLQIFGCYRLAWRRFSLKDMPRYVLSALFSCVVLTLLRLAMPFENLAHIRPPYSITLISTVLAFCATVIVWLPSVGGATVTMMRCTSVPCPDVVEPE